MSSPCADAYTPAPNPTLLPCLKVSAKGAEVVLIDGKDSIMTQGWQEVEESDTFFRLGGATFS